MVQNKKLIKNLIILLGLFALAGFLTYSLLEYQKSGIAKDGVVTCASDQCFWSAHIHVYIPIQICGEDYPLAKFKGPLSHIHTHGEENIIHWHDKLRYDAQNKVFLEPSPFALGTTFENQGIPIAAGKTFAKQDGDLCDDKKSAWKVVINGRHFSDWQNYQWKDHDIILLVFDERSVEEVENELRHNPIKFPSIGEG